VAVEEPGNRTLWEALTRSRKVELCPLKVDSHGVVVESLEEILKRKTVRMVFVSPRCQFPTGVVMSPDRARRLLELTAEHRIAIYEDDSDAEIQFTDQRSLPLLAKDTTGQVIFGASLSALMAPGTRLGYLVVPATLAAHLERVRKSLEAQGDRVSEWAFADFIRDEELARHLRRVRKVYEARRDHLCGLLREELGNELEFEVPNGGMALWLKSRGGIDMESWVNAALGCGLQLKRPRYFYLGEASSVTRMGFTQVDETVLNQAVERFKQALVMVERR
jgi:GntR family transcriptional regulator/MocR family aminotransferase